MDRIHPSHLGDSPAVPRTRGDGPAGGLGCLLLLFCSPHTRGWTARTILHPTSGGPWRYTLYPLTHAYAPPRLD